MRVVSVEGKCPLKHNKEKEKGREREGEKAKRKAKNLLPARMYTRFKTGKA